MICGFVTNASWPILPEPAMLNLHFKIKLKKMRPNQLLSATLLLLYLLPPVPAGAQTYPFQDLSLSDDDRIDNLISLMTLEEKLDNLSSRLPGVSRLGVGGTRLVEGLHGLALSGPANWAVKGKGEAPTTTFPQAYGLAQMWDPELQQELAAWEAYETRYLAQNEKYRSAGLILLAPNADLGRDIRWGRTEECYGEDAFLAGTLTAAYVKGLQGEDPRYWKVASLMKHFLANSNENERTITSSDFDERLFREYYSYPFYRGVTEGGSRAYMTAYNKYNGIPCIVHPMHRSITIPEWGQNGIICTDGGAFRLLVNAHKYYPDLTQAAAACIKAGINLFLDRYRPSLEEALDKGLVTEQDIDEALRGTLMVMLKIGLLDDSPENPYRDIGIADTVRPWTKPEARALARKATVKSAVLLKNEGLLPLNMDELNSIAVIGPSADLVVSDWYSGTPPYRVSILDGIISAIGGKAEVRFAASNKADSAVTLARESDVAIVCVGNHPLGYGLGWGENQVPSDGREAVDRQAISLEQEDLVKLVRAANPRTIMIVVSSFPYAIGWSKENVPSILHITQSSQELGNGVADIIFGKESPAGRLVQTWSASIDELLPILDYNIRNGRTYMYDRHVPLFYFGHGLNYTEFHYGEVGLSKSTIRDREDIVEVTVTISNTGQRSSDEVVQMYVAYPDSKLERPIKELKGFKRVNIPAGETMEVSIPLKARDLMYWNPEKHSWELEKGRLNLMLGTSSKDIRQTAVISVK